MGLSAGRDDPAVFLRPQVARVSLWAVLGLWLGRRLGRLLVVVVRSPSAMTGIGLAGAFVAGWHFIDPGLPLGLLGGLVLGLVVWRRRWPASSKPTPTRGRGRGGAVAWSIGGGGQPRWTPPG